jgi:uncharacterized oxidoreductase
VLIFARSYHSFFPTLYHQTLKKMELSQNTILITEGTGGLGFGFAQKLIELGNTVIITGRNARKLEEARQILPTIHTIQLDINRADDVRSLYNQVIEEFPDLNMLINSSGELPKLVFHEKRILYDITREMEINLMGPVIMVEQFLPHLQTKASAAILNVTSGIALVPFPVSCGHGTCRSELRTYTQCLRSQLYNTNIKVFELAAPGASISFTQLDGYNQNELSAPDRTIENAIERIKADTYDIDPRLANLLRVRSRLAPNSCLNN